MKVLFLGINPKSYNRLNLDGEAKEIDDALTIHGKHEHCLVQKWVVRLKDIRVLLFQERPDIVHISGHGTGKNGLVFFDEAKAPKMAKGETLRNLFVLFPSIRCVLLNSCYSNVQARAIVEQIDYVVGMKDYILDDAAIAFSQGFYTALAYGEAVETSFKHGCSAIELDLDSYSKKTRL